MYQDGLPGWAASALAARNEDKQHGPRQPWTAVHQAWKRPAPCTAVRPPHPYHPLTSVQKPSQAQHFSHQRLATASGRAVHQVAAPQHALRAQRLGLQRSARKGSTKAEGQELLPPKAMVAGVGGPSAYQPCFHNRLSLKWTDTVADRPGMCHALVDSSTARVQQQSPSASVYSRCPAPLSLPPPPAFPSPATRTCALAAPGRGTPGTWALAGRPPGARAG